jgi:hypothetical protein
MIRRQHQAQGKRERPQAKQTRREEGDDGDDGDDGGETILGGCLLDVVKRDGPT